MTRTRWHTRRPSGAAEPRGELEAGGGCSYGGYEYGYYRQRRRCKADWAGIGLGDAFRHHADFYTRLAAQKRFYDAVRRAQIASANAAGQDRGTFNPQAKVQLTPFYTGYPAAIAAHAAIGLTAFLEYKARVKSKILSAKLQDYLRQASLHDRVSIDPEIYNRMAQVVASRVEARLLIEDLSRAGELSSVEVYRLFAASQSDAGFPSVASVVAAVVLFGDLLPPWASLDLHPTTSAMLRDVTRASEPFFARLATARSAPAMLCLGAEWVPAVCRCLAPYLAEYEAAQKGGSCLHRGPDQREARIRVTGSPSDENGQGPALDDPLPPMRGRAPPALFDPPGAADRMAQALLQALSPDGQAAGSKPSSEQLSSGTLGLLAGFAQAVDDAAGQSSTYEDLRSDVLAHMLQGREFEDSPISGMPVSGHEVVVPLGGNDTSGGEMFDRAIEPRDDPQAYDALMAEAEPIVRVLRRTLYPNVEDRSEELRLRASGALDPARLAVAEFVTASYKRHRTQEELDRRGRPVLLIACDSSSSLSAAQMRMMKVLAAAWLTAVARVGVQVLAAIYHSGWVREGMSGALVQWIHHPQKTPAVRRAEAVRALASLPDAGSGAQSDALSLAFMLGEAVRLARGRMVYMIVISDCKWNKCLPGSRSGTEEVRRFLEGAYEGSGGRLHTTLVGLGVEQDTGFEDIVQKVIRVSRAQLADPAAVAGEVAEYVAACMRERRRLVNGR